MLRNSLKSCLYDGIVRDANYQPLIINLSFVALSTMFEKSKEREREREKRERDRFQRIDL